MTTLLAGAGVIAAVSAQAASGCKVSYAAPNSWAGGFTASVSVTNLGDALNGWRLTWTFPSGQQVSQAWSAAVSQSGSQVTATNLDYNGALATNGTATFGFNGTFSGSNTAPTSFALNGVNCTGSTGPTNPPPTTGPTTTPPTTKPPTEKPAFKGVANSACGDLEKLKVTWWYNWWVDNGGCKVGGFVPMVSGKKHGAGDVTWERDQAINAGYKTILGFNEPDHTDQANMSVDNAVSLWPILTADSSVRVGGPAPSGDSGGRTWFNSFMNQVQAKNLRVDFLTLHWYGWSAGSCDADATGLENQIKWMEGFPGNRPIWVTEFGCLDASNQDAAQVERFYQGALRVFARHPRVERYAWYPWERNHALVQDGNLTQLGRTLASASGTRDDTSGGAGSNDVTLVNRSSGKCLDVFDHSTADGGDVVQWTCTGAPNQRWRIEALGDGTSRIVNVGSGKALDVFNCGTADGTNIEQYTWWNNNCERWQVQDTDSGWVRLLNPNSGKVADVAGCSAADGADVRLWSWLSNYCQQWQLR